MADFPTHLRTVHFTLVFVCAVTIIALLGISPGELDLAQEQMRHVRQIKAEWSEWIARWGYDQAQGFEKMGIHSDTGVPSGIYVCPSSGRKWSFHLKGSPMRFLILVRGENDERVFADAVRKVNGDLKFYSVTGSWPMTLKDFRDFWDSATNSGMRMQVVESVGRQVHFISDKGVDSSLEWTPRCSDQSSSLDLQFRRTDKMCSERARQTLDEALFCADAPNEKLTIAVPVKFRESRIWEGPRSWLIKNYYLRASATGFEEDFRELNRVTAPYIELPIEKVNAILDAEIERSGERVQLVGLTLPLHTLVQAAAGIVVLVQMYLFLHLKQFSSLIPGKAQVAWVALYNGIFSRMLTITTGVLLPVATCVYATIAHLVFWNIAFVIISTWIAVVSARLFWNLPNHCSSSGFPRVEWPGED